MAVLFIDDAIRNGGESVIADQPYHCKFFIPDSPGREIICQAKDKNDRNYSRETLKEFMIIR